MVPPQSNGNVSADVRERSSSSSPPKEVREASPMVHNAGGPHVVPVSTKPKPQLPTPAPRPQVFPTAAQRPQHVDRRSPPPVVQQPLPYVQPVPSVFMQQSTPPIVRPKPKFTPSAGGVRVMPSNSMATSPTASTPLLSTDGVAVPGQPTPPLPRSPHSQQPAPVPPTSRVPPELPRPYKSTKAKELSPPTAPSVQAPLPPATPPKHRQPAEVPFPPAKHQYPNPNATPQQVLAASQREWFHGKISREEAQKRILNLGQYNG